MRKLVEGTTPASIHHWKLVLSRSLTAPIARLNQRLFIHQNRVLSLNPYEATPHSDAHEPTPATRSVWLLLLTGVLGIASSVLAMLILAETLGIAARGGSWNAELTKGATAATAIGSLGACWLFSAFLYWAKRRSLATTINLASIAGAVLFVALAASGLIL